MTANQYSNRSILQTTADRFLCLKLVQELKQSEITKVSYSNSSIYGKVMFVINNCNQLRVILFKDLL